jgi:trans-aconitate methyltransferase
MNNWQNIWKNRNVTVGNMSILSKLISVDGFDTGYGTINEEDWKEYVEYISKKLSLENNSLYEVGCGAGAFLYKFYQQGNKVGGLDYSSNLINIAQKYLPGGEFHLNEASGIDINEKYDFVISNSVFFYFTTYEYAKKVVINMLQKSIKGIAILEVNDYNKKDESMKLRKGYLTDKEYEERYKGLEHLYYEKQWFIDIANVNNIRIEIEQQNISNYKNNAYRFNVFMFLCLKAN